jgi:hypothetical protein
MSIHVNVRDLSEICGPQLSVKVSQKLRYKMWGMKSRAECQVMIGAAEWVIRMATERTWKVQNDRRAVKRHEVAKGNWVRKLVSACLSDENSGENMGLKISEAASMAALLPAISIDTRSRAFPGVFHASKT